MKKSIKYLTVVAVTVAYIFLYGFTVGGDPGGWFLAVLFTILFLLVGIFHYKDKSKPMRKIGGSILTCALAVGVAVVLYISINGVHADLIAEYDTEITEISRGTAVFLDPSGAEKHARLRDNRIILSDSEKIAELGDTIHIREYSGLFGAGFCETDAV